MRSRRPGQRIFIYIATALAFFLVSLPPFAVADVVTTTFADSADSTLRQDAATANYGLTSVISVHSRNKNRNRRGAIFFDLSAIPSNATIENALLNMYMETAPSQPRNIDVHRFTDSWREGTGDDNINSPGINGATWIERQYGNNIWTGSGPWDWAAQGGDFVAAATASTPTTGRGWMNWNVLPDVAAWTSGAASNYGWLIKDPIEGDGSGNSHRSQWDSRENGDAALNPVLDVTYLKADSALSTGTADVGWYGQIGVTFTNNGGAGADQVHQVSFVIPAGWSNISTAPADYAIIATGGKAWTITGPPSGTTGPQTVTATAVDGAADLADGESVNITFNVMAPWASGNSTWPLTGYGAAGGSHAPPGGTINIIGANLGLISSSDTSLTPITLSGADTSVPGTFGMLEVSDARGTAGGWNVVLASTDFLRQDSTETIPATGFYVPAPPAVTTVYGGAPPVSDGGLLAGVGLTILDALPSTGAGQYTTIPDLELMVPAQTLNGTYEATITQTLIGL